MSPFAGLFLFGQLVRWTAVVVFVGCWLWFRPGGES